MIINEIEKREEIFKNIVEKIYTKPVVVFSASNGGKMILLFLKENGIKPVAICDNDLNKKGNIIDGITVMLPNEAIEKYGTDIIYFVAADSKYESEIILQLIDYGVSGLNICTKSIISNKFLRKPLTDIQLYFKYNEKRISEIFNCLEDEVSKEIYLNCLAHLYNNYWWQFNKKNTKPNQYFQKDIFKFNDDEVYFDIGVFDGETIKEFVETVGNRYKYIYGFEADYTNYSNTMNKLKEFNSLTIYNRAVTNSNSIIKFTSAGSGSRISENGEVEVETIKGDDLEIFAPTFIKMDIEGAEMDALRGFRETIIKNKPKLAICIYHSKEDYIDIPLYIKELVPEYKIYIRNHSITSSIHETVCYATI